MFGMHFECHTTAVRLLPELKSSWKVPQMLYECSQNARGMAAEYGSSVQELSKNSNKMQLEYLECTWNGM